MMFWKKVKHHEEDLTIDVEPTRAHHDDAGFDLTYNGTIDVTILPGEVADIPCGVAIEWNPGIWGLLVGRSSTFRNRGILVNIAVIDPGYRGHLFAICRNISGVAVVIRPGERVAQIVPLPALAPLMSLLQVKELSDTTRGAEGFGSSGL